MDEEQISNPSTEVAVIDPQDITPIETEDPKSPVSLIENGLSGFLNHSFQMVKEEDDYQRLIQEEIVRRLPSMKNSELIALSVSQSSNMADLASKIISPTMQLLTAKQQAELAKQQKEQLVQAGVVSQTNIRQVNQMAPQEVLTGMRSFMDLIKQISTQPAEKSNE
jgi:hypothetical protein